MNAQVLNMAPARSQPAWAEPIACHLGLVDRKIESTVTSDVDVATDLSGHLLYAGGKRIRPALVLLSALAAGGAADDDRVIGVAAAAELLHMASLVHDDVVDETGERRGVSTANSKWGNKLSVLGGDFLLSKAFTLLAEVGNVEVLRAISAMAVKMTESEMLQTACEGSLAGWRENYWRVISGKTASFLGVCCECGAILAGAKPDVRRALMEYGSEVGLAFQITDDLLDIEGNPALTGKEVGTDLIHGKFTLPVLLALDRDSKQASSLEGVTTRDDARRIAQWVVQSGGADMAREVAVRRADSACEYLGCLPSSEHIRSLRALAASITTREV